MQILHACNQVYNHTESQLTTSQDSQNLEDISPQNPTGYHSTFLSYQHHENLRKNSKINITSITMAIIVTKKQVLLASAGS